MTLLMKILERKNHQGIGDPAKKVILNEEVGCCGCTTNFSEDENAWFCYVDNKFYCKACKTANKQPNFGLSNGGNAKRSSHVLIKYKQTPDEEELIEKIKQEYKDKFDDEEDEIPDRETLQTLAQKRINKKDRDMEEFKEEAVPVSEF